jgi:alpha-1,2-rhamnosyltransferase
VDPDVPARRVFLECTSTHASHYNTGIQRAVRNLVNASLAIAPCTAVVYNGRHFEAIDALPYQAPIGPDRKGRLAVDLLRGAFQRTRSGVIRGIPARSVRNALFSQRLEYGLRSVVYAAQNARRWAGSYGRNASPIDFQHGDVLVLLDSTWNVDLTRELKRANEAGADIWVVVNDLIPIQYPDFAPEGSPILLDRWLRRTVPYAHGLLGISHTVAEALRDHLERSGIAREGLRIEYFHLGAGIETDSDDEAIEDAVKSVFDAASGPVYLSVGTVEPRKQHALVLDAFERLWRLATDAKLVFFGRHGWRSDDLARRVRTHPEFGRRLIWIEAGSDAALDYAYRHASAMIFASRCEGFGLPLAEAMKYGLPVIASDIPVFREIGGDYPRYFDVYSADALLEAVRDFEHERAVGSVKRRPRPWLSWPDSARMLLRTVAGGVAG